MSTIGKLLALDKWARLARLFKQHGGIGKSLYKFWIMDTLKEGKYMGSDSFGNKYFENQNYMISRSRWVEYNPMVKLEYEASQITAEWYGWLHYKTDRLPVEDFAKYCLNCCCWCHCWLQPHQENLTGTEFAYYGYSTVRPSMYVWDGYSICNRPCIPL